jgi:hypothetical protein
LPLDAVRRYWRDVHSPAISRREGIYDYRHSQYNDVDPNFFSPIAGIEFECPSDQQLMWNSDVRYRDDNALALFDGTPPSDVKPHLLGDIDIIVDQSTTYRSVGEHAHTFVDNTGEATPQGAPSSPTYAIFLRQRSDEASFREYVRSLAKQWSSIDGVSRVRMSLFEVPDMEAERKAGYPIKTHPLELQYQALIEVAVSDYQVGKRLLTPADSKACAVHISTIHAYPLFAIYTSIYGGRPTLVGLRGYPAHQAIEALAADNQKQTSLLEWMYGPVAKDGPVRVEHHD